MPARDSETVPGVVSVTSTNRKPPWKPAVTRPGPAGRRVSTPPEPDRPGASSLLGAPGDVVTAVPAGAASGSPPDSVTVAEAVSTAVITRVRAASPEPTVIRLPTSRFAGDASR